MQSTKAYIMLICATLFWAGNFIIGKYAFLIEIPPLSLVFYRWLLVWIILLPFTYREIVKYKDTILNNLPLLFFLGLTSVGLFNSFTYLSLIHTQVINASLFNAAIPAIIILLCFLFKIEKTNKFQIFGLIISVGGILAIVTKLKLDILLSLKFNKGDLILTGTPSNSRPVEPGSIVRVEVESLGVLENIIVEGKTSLSKGVGAMPKDSNHIRSISLGSDNK